MNRRRRRSFTRGSALAAVLVVGCSSTSGSSAGTGDDEGARDASLPDASTGDHGGGDGGSDASASTGGDASVPSSDATSTEAGASRPSYPPGKLAGTLVFSASFDADAMAANAPNQLYSIDLGTTPYKTVPLTVTPGKSTLMPSFSQDGQQLFFNQIDQDPASPTYLYDVLVTARPDASNPRVLAPCGNPKDSNSPPYCQYAAVGADGDVWYAIENKGSVLNGGYEIAHVALTAGATPKVWLDFPDTPVCTIQSMAMSPDGAALAFILGDAIGCGTGKGGVYVVPITASGISGRAPITPYGSLDGYTQHFTAFNRAGDRVYYIGEGSELYSEKLDGSDVKVEETGDLSQSQPGQLGVAIVNDAYYVFGGGPVGIAAYPFASVSGGTQMLVTMLQPFGRGMAWK